MTERVTEKKYHKTKTSDHPVILVGCPFLSRHIQALLEQKMALFLERNMVAIISHEKVSQCHTNISYLSSTCQGCGSCDANTAKEIIAGLDVDLLCTQLILLANEKHPVISK